MAKKKANKQINVIVAFVAAVLGVAAICMMFLPAIGIKDTDTTYTGMQVAFGYTEVAKLPIIGTEIKAFQSVVDADGIDRALSLEHGEVSIDRRK